MRIKVQVKSNDSVHNDYKKGERGVIDGYVRGGNDAPFAVVLIDDRLEMIPLNLLRVIKTESSDNYA